ncbi:MAG: 50S ribosomal protein L22 [Deltaproteobacteria bacterium]|jgi:large subunit ribosomal protein L22|nr:50S ribosomal protein L22 [Deltaproteobacteria bacterium]
MEATSIAKYVRVSPRRAQLVARNVNGLPVEDALNILKFTPNKAAGLIYMVMRSALANAEENNKADVDSLIVKQVIVNEGPTWKRFMPRSQGRANTILKRTSHITVILED